MSLVRSIFSRRASEDSLENGFGGLAINSTSHRVLSLSADGKTLILTVVNGRVPTAFSHNPYVSAVERYVRPIVPLIRTSATDLTWEENGWTMAMRDDIPGLVDLVSASNDLDARVLAVAYRVFHEEDSRCYLRLYPISGQSFQHGSHYELPLPGNTRVTALALHNFTIYYSRDGDFRLFRMASPTAPSDSDAGSDSDSEPKPAPSVPVSPQWGFQTPGPFVDRTGLFTETIALSPLYANSTNSALLSVFISASPSGQLAMYLKTYARLPMSTTSPSPPPQEGSSPSESSAPETDPPVYVWKASARYWEHPLYGSSDDDFVDPLSIRSSSCSTVIFCFDRLLLSIDWVPSKTNLAGAYTTTEVIPPSPFVPPSEAVTMNPTATLLALLLQDGDIAILARGPVSDEILLWPSDSDSASWLSSSFSPPRKKLSELLGKGLGISVGTESLQQSAPRAWQVILKVPELGWSVDQDEDDRRSHSQVAGLLISDLEPFAHLLPRNERSRIGYLFTLCWDGSIHVYDLGSVRVVSPLRSFFQTRWKLVIGVLALLTYFLWYELTLRRRLHLPQTPPPGPRIPPRPPAPVPPGAPDAHPTTSTGSTIRYRAPDQRPEPPPLD